VQNARHHRRRQHIDYYLTGRTKAAPVNSLENGLSAVKASAEQSSSRLTEVSGSAAAIAGQSCMAPMQF
jgi:hypothetical protein